MRDRAIALPLFLVLAFGVLAGPHPCPAEEEQAGRAEPAATPACHSSPAGGAPEEAPAPERLLCDKACNAPALIAAPLAPVDLGLIERLPAPEPRSVLASFTPPPDHVPLA